MCSVYDPRVYDILSRWSFGPAKDVSAPSYPQDQRPVSRVTASSDDRSQHSELTKSGNNHTYRRYSSAGNELPTFDVDWPEEKAGAIPSSLDLQKPPTTKQATSHHSSTQMWPSPFTNPEVLRVIGYRTIFGRGYDEKNEFWPKESKDNANHLGGKSAAYTIEHPSLQCLIPFIVPLSVGAWSNLSNLHLGFPGEGPGFIGESDPLAEDLRGSVQVRMIFANNGKNVVRIKAGRFVTSPKALLVPVDNVWHGLLNIEL
ncbi:hypothetical protein FAUST_8443 [Fusarium austroamericanum]|uniref:Uncharacterized protein n=1 Tax=Fusarium austroamericanum TaxID=282268 RepID=A0AAN5Z4Y0_FUSAU|nr:hypothetical protein FAUST_8443 [Fusarium austroamericanum]